jgi:hypothetical protein
MRTAAESRFIVLRLARRAVVYEIGMWRSLYRWVSRRPATTEPGAEAFGHAGASRPILLTLIGVSAIEVPILDVILSHTGLEWLRPTALGLGIYGLLWMLGLLASQQVTPHVVGPGGLRVRSGTTIDVTVPWQAVATVAARYRSLPSGRTVQVEGDPGRVLSIAAMSQTSVDVTLRTPTALGLRGGPSEPVTELRFYADQPDALVAHARRLLSAEAHPPAGSAPGPRPRY